MPKKVWTLEEKKAFAEKMRLAREAKKKPEVIIHTDGGTETPAPVFIKDIVNSYFPKAKLEVEDRGQDYFIKIILGAEDTRAFVVDKPSASIETTNWCKKIQANIEGKPTSTATGIETARGLRSSMKKLPDGMDDEFFFRT